ncbi:Uncharacterized conserved protein [Pseudomonas syringae pv. actinidiae]|uniref:Uncharacterized conserved protein n=1 Tax=Pseudomonas syringae pv. actinidiae TaxID=103796 RepID=A0A2V0QC01_PSESF|nr:Uncharacterized conserved protein [Pseudomonas syringae pv. actinidiae]
MTFWWLAQVAGSSLFAAYIQGQAWSRARRLTWVGPSNTGWLAVAGGELLNGRYIVVAFMLHSAWSTRIMRPLLRLCGPTLERLCSPL